MQTGWEGTLGGPRRGPRGKPNPMLPRVQEAPTVLPATLKQMEHWGEDRLRVGDPPLHQVLHETPGDGILIPFTRMS